MYWYSSTCVLGKNTLNEMMKKISDRAGLSRVYTNHCIRSTTVPNLVDNGHTMEEIKAVTGHRSNDSVSRYTKRISEKRKINVSHSLTAGLHQDSTKTEVFTVSHEKVVSSQPTPSGNPTVILEKNGARVQLFS
uniref:Phage_integrase domain-containing protein n=1 Tax=Macrostomum lignano TaxID=282301 RepID=A0A1I8H3P6_9PLAT